MIKKLVKTNNYIIFILWKSWIKNMTVKNPFDNIEDLTSVEVTPNLIPIIQLFIIISAMI